MVEYRICTKMSISPVERLFFADGEKFHVTGTLESREVDDEGRAGPWFVCGRAGKVTKDRRKVEEVWSKVRRDLRNQHEKARYRDLLASEYDYLVGCEPVV